MDVFPKVESLEYGSSWSGVISTKVIFEDGDILGKADFEGGYPISVKGVSEPMMTNRFVLVEAKVIQVKPMVICEVGESSSCFPLGPVHASQINRVVELCSGIGVFSHMATFVGLNPSIGVDMNPKWANLFAKLHHAEFLVGECNDSQIIRSLFAKGMQGAVVLAGISCQPHSRAGDRLGMSDNRSRSLPQVLQVAWMAQTPILVLECVPEIHSNVEAQKIINDFVSKTGRSITQQVLKLNDAWCTRRDRWFAVLTLGGFPEITIPAMPVTEQFRRIGQVMPKAFDVSAKDLQQLQLSLYELSKFHEYGCGGIAKLMINFAGVLPTCLHSAGNQLYPCRCGCHQGLSLKRIQDKGLFGTLIGLGESVFHNGINMEHCRYLHPCEMFLLHGGLPKNWGDDLKLALAGIGQCVAPLQGLWVLLHVKQQIDHHLNMPTHCIEDSFKQYVESVLASRVLLFPEPELPACGVASASGPCVRTWFDHDQDVLSNASFAPTTTVKQFKEAECRLKYFLQGAIPGHGVFPVPIVVDDHQIAVDDASKIVEISSFAVGGKRKRIEHIDALPCPCEDWVEEAKQDFPEVSPTIQFVVSDPVIPALDGLRNRAFLEISCPRIHNCEEWNNLARTTLPADERIELLQRQGDVWADDEVRMHLNHLAEQSPKEQNVVVWDPVLVTSVVMYGHFGIIDELASKLPPAATVITAVIIEKHWYPLLWRVEVAQAWAFTCGHAWGFSVAINRLHQRVCQALKCQLTAVRFHSLAFRVESCCGAMAIQYIHHLIWGHDLPVSLPQLQERNRLFRNVLLGLLSSIARPQRPWIWGLGEGTWFQTLKDVLTEHGVKQEDVQERAQLVVDKLGEKAVVGALKSQSAWKELKWYASQCVPMFQIIRPSELQAVVDLKVQSGKPIGTRAQKKQAKGKSKGKGKFSDEKVVDPSSLRVETGLFQCGQDLPLSQITMQQVGPQASGIVLCTRAQAEPFLKTGRITSTGGLALIIVDHIEVPPTTPLLVERVRFPTLCLANSEPVLVDGLMYQLGAQSVVRKMAQPKFEIVSVDTCVIKFAMFRDQIPIAWDVFAAHPLKFLFSKIQVLQPCKKEGCDSSCPMWHPEGPQDVAEPIFEVWGRQFMLLTFKPVPADQAEVYAVHLRLPARLELPLQQFSGLDGIFLEPKEIDGRRPSSSFQVFWQQRFSFQEVVHLKQITANALGIARMGSKYGIRCQTCHAESVHATIRPGGQYLPQGKKTHYLLGPVPFGTLKTSVSQILDLLSWSGRPMHTVPTASHINGVMWKIAAVDPPPETLVLTDHGEMLITRIDEPTASSAPSSSLLGASHTVSLVTSQAPKIDPLQMNDPWEKHRGVGQMVNGPTISACDPAEALEKKVVEAVVAKLSATNMNVDSDDGQNARVTTLEQKVNELHASQTQLHSIVVEQSNRQQTQINAIQAQGDRLEVTVNESVSQIESFQSQFQSQIEKQQGQLDTLFQQQMDRIESLFQKKARTS